MTYVRTGPAIVFSIVSEYYNAATVRPSKNRQKAYNLDTRAGAGGKRTGKSWLSRAWTHQTACFHHQCRS